jgi:alkylhydroperoxidase/carboxymuconolactone decarboxylase family protein YurZ
VQIAGPGARFPGFDLPFALVADDPHGGVQDAVAQRLGLGVGQGSVEAEQAAQHIRRDRGGDAPGGVDLQIALAGFQRAAEACCLDPRGMSNEAVSGEEGVGPPAANDQLDPIAVSVIDFAVLTTIGHRSDDLTTATGVLLDRLSSPEDVLELALHLVPFIGFGRALGGVAAARQVFAERDSTLKAHRTQSPPNRYENGLDLLRRIAGEPAEAVLDRLRDLSPDLARILVELTYGDVYSRRALGTRLRLLATISALTALGDTAPLLRAQIQAGLRNGWTAAQIRALVARAEPNIGAVATAEAVAAWQAVTRP